MYLVGCRYYNKNIIPKTIHKKYSNIENNLLGINDYFMELQIPIVFTNENDYKIFVNYLCNKLCKTI
jgi:hypothetical protein